MQLAAARSDVSSPDPLRESCGRRVLGDDPWVVEAARRGGRYGIKAYTAREWDPEIGLYYYRARYYDPKIGRFISEDSLGFLSGVNFYGYVDGNPVNKTDPFGLMPVWVPTPSTPGGCEFFWGYAYPIKEGEEHGWPYAHCLASCLVAKNCSQVQSQAAGMAKEVADTVKCLFTRDPGSCDSAWQPSDKADNFTGATCPTEINCWDACDHLKGRKGGDAPPPGPFSGWGR